MSLPTSSCCLVPDPVNHLQATPLSSEVDIGPLTMQLSGVVDAAVQGGVMKYREAFFEGTYMDEFPDHRRHQQPFSRALAHQISIVRKVTAFAMLSLSLSLSLTA